jgi:hypothetical protein
MSLKSSLFGKIVCLLLLYGTQVPSIHRVHSELGLSYDPRPLFMHKGKMLLFDLLKVSHEWSRCACWVLLASQSQLGWH